jgi:SET domain-containing protein
MQNIIKDTGTAKGRGVFAARSYVEGEVVEEAPVIPLAAPFRQIPRELQLIVFLWKDGKVALSLGYGSLYNHNNPANLLYEADFDNNVIRYVAYRDIAADEELTINYNSDGGVAEWHDDNWFEKNRIKRIS